MLEAFLQKAKRIHQTILLHYLYNILCTWTTNICHMIETPLCQLCHTISKLAIQMLFSFRPFLKASNPKLTDGSNVALEFGFTKDQLLCMSSLFSSVLRAFSSASKNISGHIYTS